MEREEVVQAKVRLRHLGEELFLIGQGVVFGVVAVDVPDLFEAASFADPFPREARTSACSKSEDLVVAGVGQFVEDGPGLLVVVPGTCELGRVGNVDALLEGLGGSRVPSASRRSDGTASTSSDPCVASSQIGTFRSRLTLSAGRIRAISNSRSSEQPEGPCADFAVFAFEEAVIDLDGPALDRLPRVGGRDWRIAGGGGVGRQENQSEEQGEQAAARHGRLRSAGRAMETGRSSPLPARKRETSSVQGHPGGGCKGATPSAPPEAVSSGHHRKEHVSSCGQRVVCPLTNPRGLQSRRCIVRSPHRRFLQSGHPLLTTVPHGRPPAARGASLDPHGRSTSV